MTNELLENVDIHKCLCCGQAVEKRGRPVTAERADTAFRVLTGLGFTRAALLGKHRAQIDYQTPGFAEWLEERAP